MSGSSPIFFTLPFTIQVGVAYDIIFYFDNATNQCGIYWNGTLLVTGGCNVFYNATENGTVIGAEWYNPTTNFTTNHQQGKIFAWQYYPYSTLTLTNLLAYNQYEMLLNANCLAFYKCDEHTGATAYDSSGNGKYGVITHTTFHIFHSTQNLYSYQNEAGYNYQTPIWNSIDATLNDFSAYGFDGNGGQISGVTKVNNKFRITLQDGATNNFIQTSAANLGYLGSKDAPVWLSIPAYVTIIAKVTLISGILGRNPILYIGTGLGTDLFPSGNNTYSGTLSGMIANATIEYIGVSIGNWMQSEGYVADIEFSIVFGAYHPRNENLISQDVLGKKLLNSGRVKYNAILKNSNCVTFSGFQYIDFGPTPATELSNFIVSFFANPGGTFPYSTLASVSYNDDSGTGRGGYRIRKGPNNSIMMDSGNGGEVLAQTNTVFSNPNIWYHFVLVYNDGVGQFYVNGVADGAPITAGLNYPPVGGPKNTGLGCMLADFNQSNPTSFWEGGLAGFQIAPYSTSNFSKALAQQNLDNVVFYAPLSEGDGFTAHDVSVNQKHGTIFNSTIETFWGTKQNYFHYNLMKGFSMVSGVRIPALNNITDATGNALTNFAQPRAHNGAETTVDFTSEVNSPYAISFAVPNNYTVTTNTYQNNTTRFAANDPNAYKNYLVYDASIGSANIAKIKNYLKQS